MTDTSYERSEQKLTDYARTHGCDTWKATDIKNGRWRVVLTWRQEFGGNSHREVIEKTIANTYPPCSGYPATHLQEEVELLRERQGRS